MISSRGVLLSMLLLSAGVAGCYQPSTGTEIIDGGIEPPGTLFGADGGVNGTCGGADPSPLAMLHVRVRTSAVGGRYAPRNVGAIWIEDTHGVFVKTLERWGATRARYLVRWNATSHGNVVDAVTSATLSQHTTHNRDWNLTNLMKCEIPNGDYRVVIEHTDRNSAGATYELPFTKGTMAADVTGPDATNFHDALIELR